MLYRKGNRWELCEFKVRYTQDGQEYEKYTNDKQWWLDFEQKWEHTQIVEFIDISYTDEQKERLEEIRNMPEDFGDIYSIYVEIGKVEKIPNETHPFNIIRLKRENENLGREVSEREIQEIVQGQQISDLEIRLMMGGL